MGTDKEVENFTVSLPQWRARTLVCVCVYTVSLCAHVCAQESQPISLDGVGQQLGVTPRAQLCLLQQPLFYQVKLVLWCSWYALKRSSFLISECGFYGVFTSFLYCLSYLQLADWFDHCMPCWLANWMTEWPHAAQRSTSQLTICLLCLLLQRRKILGWEKSLKDGAVKRESLFVGPCARARVKAAVRRFIKSFVFHHVPFFLRL